MPPGTYVLMLMFFDHKTHWIYRALSNKHFYLFAIVAGTCVQLNSKENKEYFSIARKLKRLSFTILKKFIKNNYDKIMNRIVKKVMPVQSLDLIVGSTHYVINSYANSYPITSKTKKRFIHHHDYDRFLENNLEEKNIVTFIDTFEPFHPDYILSNTKQIDPKIYYDQLNAFFDFIEQKYNTTIVIAEHPKSYYDQLPDYFKGRKRVKWQTAKYIAQSRFVITHESTSLSLIILYNKPMILLNFTNTTEYLTRTMNDIRYYLNKKVTVFNKDDLSNVDIDLTIDDKIYKKMKDEYLVGSDTNHTPLMHQVRAILKTNLKK